jgi:hypothetical protein
LGFAAIFCSNTSIQLLCLEKSSRGPPQDCLIFPTCKFNIALGVNGCKLFRLKERTHMVSFTRNNVLWILFQLFHEFLCNK